MVFEIAICHHQLKAHAEALEALRYREWSFTASLMESLTSVTSVDPKNYEARLRMATVLDEMGQKDEALDIVDEGK